MKNVFNRRRKRFKKKLIHVRISRRPQDTISFQYVLLRVSARLAVAGRQNSANKRIAWLKIEIGKDAFNIQQSRRLSVLYHILEYASYITYYEQRFSALTNIKRRKTPTTQRMALRRFSRLFVRELNVGMDGYVERVKLKFPDRLISTSPNEIHGFVYETRVFVFK